MSDLSGPITVKANTTFAKTKDKVPTYKIVTVVVRNTSTLIKITGSNSCQILINCIDAVKT
jgi:hypothetical protein